MSKLFEKVYSKKLITQIHFSYQTQTHLIHTIIVLFLFFQLCEGGPVIDLCKGLIRQGKKMREEHIGFILREVIKVTIK